LKKPGWRRVVDRVGFAVAPFLKLGNRFRLRDLPKRGWVDLSRELLGPELEALAPVRVRD
jgi:hypothetical protein